MCGTIYQRHYHSILSVQKYVSLPLCSSLSIALSLSPIVPHFFWYNNWMLDRSEFIEINLCVKHVPLNVFKAKIKSSITFQFDLIFVRCWIVSINLYYLNVDSNFQIQWIKWQCFFLFEFSNCNQIQLHCTQLRNMNEIQLKCNVKSISNS